MKICIATGTRAEYGLLKPLIDQIVQSEKYTLQLLVTGAHLSPEFGLTYRQIEQDGLVIDAKVEMLLSSDTPEGIVKSMGLGMIGFTDALKNLQPDLIIILGDRYEMLALASTALIFQIPIAHLHGGEITEGAYDDAIRHSITKMSHLHFTSTEVHRQRVIQLGENPAFVFNVGAIGLDNIRLLPLFSKKELALKLGRPLKKFNYLVTFHPSTLDHEPAELQFRRLLNVIDQQKDSLFIFTKANADTNGRIINEMIDDYVKANADKSVAYTSMGQLFYLSALKYATAVVGNSSSGIIEAPFFNVPTINIGDRQKGRMQAKSILNCNTTEEEIENCFSQVSDEAFLNNGNGNLFGEGRAAELIIDALNDIDFKLLRTKPFFDI